MLVKIGNTLVNLEAIKQDLCSARFVPKGTMVVPAVYVFDMQKPPPKEPTTEARLHLYYRSSVPSASAIVEGSIASFLPSCCFNGEEAEVIWDHLCREAKEPRREPLL